MDQSLEDTDQFIHSYLPQQLSQILFHKLLYKINFQLKMLGYYNNYMNNNLF
ncbi:unnamed protein product [Paramecium sonneborni]|uniref:Uncharacterized protein n=1 Tax=Paramecium sonneborni TaxID=65129 RepID=A0A8S1RVE4_9CILI|nr:unnamed protein product [Paramecium sonneborni]CAD8131342.1 unnamed protein product [Paramecium sonneborni]